MQPTLVDMLLMGAENSCPVGKMAPWKLSDALLVIVTETFIAVKSRASLPVQIVTSLVGIRNGS